MKFRSAFTLAEVLLTLGIIGVVAAITIPIINNAYNDLELKSAFKKSYQVLTSANNLMMNDNGGTLSNLPNAYFVVIGQYLKYSKYCSNNSQANGCWHLAGVVYSPSGIMIGAPTNNPQTTFAGGGYILDDGTLVTFYGNWAAGASLAFVTLTTEPVYTELLIDVNGFKPPNIVGRDVFCFFPSNKGLLPFAFMDGYNWGATYTMLKTF